MKIAFVIFIFLLFSISCYAEDLSHIPFKHLETKEGLSMVTCVLRDKNDYLWIGNGEDGLVMYNTHNLIRYKNNPNDSTSISDNHVLELYEDSKGNIWVATLYGVNRLDASTGKFVRYLTDGLQNAESTIKRANDILEDSSGRLWITAGTGLYEYLYEKDSMVHHALNEFPYSSKQITSIAEDKKGHLWLACFAPCICKYNPTTKSNKTFSIKELPNKSEFEKHVIIDREENLWLAINDYSFSSFDTENQSFKHYLCNKDGSGLSSDKVKKLLEYDNDYILVATDQGGINVFNKKTKRFKYISTKHGNAGNLTADGILSLSIDKENILWVGTSRGGVNYYNPKENIFTNYKKSPRLDYPETNTKLSNGVVGCFLEDSKGLIWIGTDGGGINILDKNTGRIKVYNTDNSNLSTNIIRSISEDSEGNIVVGCWNHYIDKFIRDKGEFIQYIFKTDFKIDANRSTIWSTMVDHKDRLWITLSEGHVLLYNKEGSELYRRIHYDVTSFDHVNVSFCDAHQNIHFINEEGLFEWVEEDMNFNHLLKRQDIVSVIKDDAYNYLIATMDSGVIVFDKNLKEVERYNTNNALSDNRVCSIIKANATDVWVATKKGLNQINTQTKKINNYRKADGLQNEQYFIHASLKSSTGSLYFGGTQGVDTFEPSNIKINSTPPKVYFSKVNIFDKTGNLLYKLNSVNQDEPITLEWNQNRIEFNFFAINYTFPLKTKYKYRLVGFDKEKGFTNTSSKHATYTNIAPGKYTFQVFACNNDKVWDHEGKSIIIIIKSPYWKKAWFYALLLLIAIAIVYLIILRRERKLIKEKKVLEQHVKERTVKIESQKEVLLNQHEELLSQREQLEQHQHILEDQVKKRTSELIVAKEKAEKSDRLKSYFLANMSHEIRTPMNAIIGFTQLLNDENLCKEEKCNFLDIIVSNSNSLLHLIEDILDFSQIEANQLQINFTTFNICKLIDEIHSTFSIRNQNKALTITKVNDLNPSAIQLISDEYRIRQILVNLISNAIKFTKKGNITIGVCSEDGNIKFYVSDTGNGMSEKQQKIIFNQFVKLNRDQQNAARGIGLGLAISKRLANLLKGDLTVESEVKKGSTFILSIPTHLQSPV